MTSFEVKDLEAEYSERYMFAQNVDDIRAALDDFEAEPLVLRLPLNKPFRRVWFYLGGYNRLDTDLFVDGQLNFAIGIGSVPMATAPWSWNGYSSNGTAFPQIPALRRSWNDYPITTRQETKNARANTLYISAGYAGGLNSDFAALTPPVYNIPIAPFELSVQADNIEFEYISLGRISSAFADGNVHYMFFLACLSMVPLLNTSRK